MGQIGTFQHHFLRVYCKCEELYRGSGEIRSLLRCKGDNMKKIFTKEWWIAALIRALRTIAQTAIATIGTAVVLSDVNWIQVVSASILAGILSILTSFAGLPEVKDE